MCGGNQERNRCHFGVRGHPFCVRAPLCCWVVFGFGEIKAETGPNSLPTIPKTEHLFINQGLINPGFL